jgi:hypothetical protein
LSWFSQKRRALSLSVAETSEVGRNIFCMEAPLLGKIHKVHGSTSIELLTTAARLGKKNGFSSHDCAATKNTSMI